MSDKTGSLACQLGCWIAAAVAGLLAILIMLVVGDLSVPGAVFVGGLLTVVLGVLLSWLLCRPLPTLDEVRARGPVGGAGSSTGAGTGTGAGAGSGSGSGTTAGSGTAAASASGSAGASAAASAGSAGAGSSAAAATKSAPESAAKGGTSGSGTDASADKAAADAGVKPIGAAAAAEERAETAGEGDDHPTPIGAAAAADEAAEAASTGGDVDYDKDGKIEGKDEGEKPKMLDGPRDGKADNLKEIKGVGPKLEKMLNGMGVYHFDQVSKWTAQELAWVDANLEGFKGRASRDEWVKQAKILASGGETEFSKRVDEGDVY